MDVSREERCVSVYPVPLVIFSAAGISCHPSDDRLMI